MTELIRTWIMGLTAAAFLTSLAMTLTPKGRTRAVVSLVCGLVTIIALVAPLMEFDPESEFANARGFEAPSDTRMEALALEQERLTRLIISERIGTYILDKAENLGLVDLTVQVETISTEGGDFLPAEIWVAGTYSAEQRRTLSEFVTRTFGIPPEKQHWSDLHYVPE